MSKVVGKVVNRFEFDVIKEDEQWFWVVNLNGELYKKSEPYQLEAEAVKGVADLQCDFLISKKFNH